MNKIHILRLTIVIMTIPVIAGELHLEVDLRKPWRFEIGNHPSYKDPHLDDSKWERIRVPGNWEDLGFPGYDGYAWYRTHFKLSNKLAGATLYLNLGQIDDVDRVYLNGHFINGSGGFPPTVQTAWDRNRLYLISNEFLNFEGDNCLAVQVYDNEAEGGIRKGNIGLYSKEQAFQLAYNLAGLWRFKPGDNPEYAKTDYPDKEWKIISAPAKWEHQGFPDLDGFAWYRKTFILPKHMADDQWILVLGRIDDVDEVYVNGIKIGQTGEFPDRTDLFINTGYGKLRLYSIPRAYMKANTENVIAVRIFDKGGDGGIYEGPIGLISRKNYLKKRGHFK